MIPVFMKDALLKARAIEIDEADAEPETPRPGDPVIRGCLLLIAAVFVFACLQVTKSISMPVLAGVILGLVFGPLVDRLVRLGMPTGLAAALLVGLAVLALAAIIGLFAAPFAIWSDRLPELGLALKHRMVDLIQLVKPIADLGTQMTTSPAPQQTVAAVETSAPWLTLAVTSTSVGGGLLISFATMYFYLASRRELKARALRLCLGASARQHAGQFLTDLEGRISAYFGIVTVINLAMGAATALIVWGFGLPLAPLWGLVAFLLNYIAFVGPMIMMVLLAGAGLVDEGSLAIAVAPALAYLAIHLVEGNIVTPLTVGRRMTINPFLVFLSFVFWLWLWGPVGAVLATPILLISVLAVESWRSWRRQYGDAPILAAKAAPAEPVAADEAADAAAGADARQARLAELVG